MRRNVRKELLMEINVICNCECVFQDLLKATFLLAAWLLCSVYCLCILCFKIVKKAMIRNRYNRIPHPILNTKRERDIYSEEGTKIKTAKVKNQEDTSFPTDGDKARLNKLNSNSKTNRKRTNIDN